MRAELSTNVSRRPTSPWIAFGVTLRLLIIHHVQPVRIQRIWVNLQRKAWSLACSAWEHDEEILDTGLWNPLSLSFWAGDAMHAHTRASLLAEVLRHTRPPRKHPLLPTSARELFSARCHILQNVLLVVGWWLNNTTLKRRLSTLMLVVYIQVLCITNSYYY